MTDMTDATEMTDDEKVRKMFDIRVSECPHLADHVNCRVDEFCNNTAYGNYQALLRMYNERYVDQAAVGTTAETVTVIG